jgi:hypothetical protein
MNNQTNYILFTGASGVGKSTWIKRWTTTLRSYGYTVSRESLGSFSIPKAALSKDAIFRQTIARTGDGRFCFIEVITPGPMEISFSTFLGAQDLFPGLAGFAAENALGEERGAGMLAPSDSKPWVRKRLNSLLTISLRAAKQVPEYTTQYNMPIVIRQFENGPSIPSIQCDHCAELVQEVNDLIVTWTLEQYKEPVFTPLLLHKACERMIKNRMLPTTTLAARTRGRSKCWHTSYPARRCKGQGCRT